jgi:hypothetical protein
MYNPYDSNDGADDMPLDPAKRLTSGGMRAAALEKALQGKYGGSDLPDRSSSHYVTNEQPMDSINVDGNQQTRGNLGGGSYSAPAKTKDYGVPGYVDSSSYAVKAGGAPGSVTRLDNDNAMGDIDDSFAVDDSERKFLQDQYDRGAEKWRKRHHDMTMTNGAGQSFTMAQSRPSLRADAAMRQLQMLRAKIEADSVQGQRKSATDSAKSKADAEVARYTGETSRLAAEDAQKAYDEGIKRADYAAHAPDREAKLAEERKAAAREAEIQAINGGVTKEEALYNASHVPQRRAAAGVAKLERKGWGTKANAMADTLAMRGEGVDESLISEVNKPSPDAVQQEIATKMAASPQLKGQYGRVQNAIKQASQSTLGFVDTFAIADARKAVSAHAKDMVRLGFAPDIATATDVLVNSLLDDTAPVGGAHTRASQAMAEALESLRGGNGGMP